jgi:4-amino-4-deoxy-L-arabinose transferase-like glycosyltransferase
MKTSERTSPKPPPAVSSHPRSHLFFAVLTALLLRFVVVGFVYQGFLVPGRDHWEFGYEMGKIAYSITSGRGFSNPYWIETGPTAMVTPVFPYLISSAFSLFGAYTKAAALAVLTLNSLVSALTCIPIFFLARNSFGLRTAVGVIWTWAFFPYAVYFSASSMWHHSLVALLLTCLLWIASYLETRAFVWMWAGFGFLWGVAVLTNPVVLAVLPFLGGWVCYRLHRNGKRWKMPALTLVCVLLATVAPWMVRNYRTFHHPVFLKDNFWMEVCIGNLGNAADWWNGSVHPAGNDAELAEFRRLGELGYMQREREQALAYIRGHPAIVLWRSIRRVVYMWTGFWSLRPEYLRGEPFDLANIFFCTVVTVLALTGLRKALQSPGNKAMPYILTLVSFPVAYYLTHSEIPYRQPIDPELVALASFAVFSRQKATLNLTDMANRQ